VSVAGVITHLQAATKLTPEQVDRVLRAVRTSLADNLARASSALASGDYASLAKAAHTLKSTLLQCGLGELAQLAEEINQAAQDGDLSADNSSQSLRQLEKLLAPLTLEPLQDGGSSQ
jgi:HPt (histidine-containing phosphotransfer) domain-containing protein